MSSLTHIEKRTFETLFNMASGYVLDFNDQKYSEFFREIVKINIDDQKYFLYGSSKAKRLRKFWEIESDNIVGKILEEMLKIWLHIQEDKKQAQVNQDYILATKIVNRLLNKENKIENSESDFLSINFSKISISKLSIEQSLIPIINNRFEEVNRCLDSKSFFASVLLAGSILEGLLLGFACNNPKNFNQANASPKNSDGRVHSFDKWTLGNFIDVAHEIKLLKKDVKKFSHILRDFRNYIHPYLQMTSDFQPDEHTAKICLQVLKAAIADLSGERL